MAKLNFDSWMTKYRPVQNTEACNAACEGKMFETFGNELDFVIATNRFTPNKVWTIVETDTGKLRLTNGYHVVNPFVKPVTCTFARQCSFADTKETKRFTDRSFVAFSEEDARKLVDHWNKSSDNWKYWVAALTPCYFLPEGDWLEETGVKYQFAKEKTT